MKLKHITLIISVIAILSLTACQDMQNPTGTDPTESAIVMNNAVEIDGALATAQVVECTFESDAFVPGGDAIYENSRMDRKDMGKGCPRKGGPKDRPMLGKVMRELQLTDAQIELLKGYNLAHRDCIELTMQTWRDAVAPVMEIANAAKKLVMDDLKNNVITRKEAYDKLKVINESMRAEIDALGMKDTIKLAIEDCNKALLASIEGMLTPDQLVIWAKYFPKK